MLRLLILVSLCAVISASLPSYVLDYPHGLQRLFSTKREVSAEEKEDTRGVCKTDECKLIANVIKDSMDESVDPCDDFYEYACGRWSKHNPTPENKTQWSLWNMVSKKVQSQIQDIIQQKPKPDDLFAVKLSRKWYQSCMDTDAIERRGVEPILSTLWRHGGWPLIMEDGEWDEDVYNWQIVDDQYARLVGFSAFHDLSYGYVTYEGNASILIEPPHLPIGVHRLIPTDLLYGLLLDSSDENNESGEGSQEKGSREKGQQQQDNESEAEDNEENEEEEEDEDEWDTAEEDEEEGKLQKRRLAARKYHRRLGRGGRRKSQNKIIRKHLGKEKIRRRNKRDAMKQKILHRLLHRVKKANKHGAKGKKHGQNLAHNKLSTKRSNMKHKNNHKMKKISKAEDEEEKELHNKKMGNKRIPKRLGHDKKKNRKSKAIGKHAHGTKIKVKSTGTGMKARSHTIQHQRHQKITNHRAHHAANQMSISKRKQISQFNSTEDTDNDVNTGNDDGNENNNGNEKKDDDGDDDEVGNNEDNEENEDNDEDKEKGDDENEETDEEKDNDDDETGNEDEDDEDEDDEDEDDLSEDDEDEDDENEEEKLQRMKEKYREHILNVSLVLSKGRSIEIPREQMLKDIDDLIEFIIKLTELTLLEDDEPTNTTLAELQTFYKDLGAISRNNKINWIRKVQKVFMEAGMEIDDDVEIVVTCSTYISKLHSLLAETPRRVLVNYVHWLFINKALLAGTEELRKLAEIWIGKWVLSEREEECLAIVDLTNVAGYQYVQQYFSEDVAKSARDMIDDIQKEVEYQIKASSWMNNDTKHFILDKLVHMKNWIGYPEWYRNATIVKRYFYGLTLGPSFYENVLNYIRYLRWKSLRKMLQDEQNQNVDDMLNPLELNAFFMPTENSISITAADLQSPFFAHNRPWYVNFGIIGLVMGHEVNHGFDDTGHLYDREGNRMEWLTVMAQAYNKRAKCFVDQYNKYSLIKGENFTVEDYGNQTVGENIADTMGLHTVFRAYKRRERECGKMDPVLPGLEKFSNDQLFFLSFANLWCETVDETEVMESAIYDVHSTGRLRVIGPASNSEDFAKAFKCPVGSAMNPERKCNIWE